MAWGVTPTHIGGEAGLAGLFGHARNKFRRGAQFACHFAGVLVGGAADPVRYWCWSSASRAGRAVVVRDIDAP